jgi:hypothetical protein
MRGFNGHPDLSAILARQRGLITRRQALDLGMSGPHIDGLVRTGQWVLVRRGVYTPGHRWRALDLHDGRARARARAAYLQMRAAAVLSHESAARELGLAILTPDEDIIHVTRHGARGNGVEHGVKHHRAPYSASQVIVVEGVPVLDAARTSVDIAREHGYVHGVVACDSARQLGVDLASLWEAAAPMVCWPEVTVVRAAIQDSDPGAESVNESLGRILVNELGLGPVQTQFEIVDGSRHARCDMRIGRHLVECDGFAKYLSVEQGGLANEDAVRVVWREKQREDWLRGHRLGMSRLIWADYWGPRRELAKERLRREYDATCAAYGTDISDLDHLLVRRSR